MRCVFYVLFNVFLRCFGQVKAVKTVQSYEKYFIYARTIYNVMKHKNSGKIIGWYESG